MVVKGCMNSNGKKEKKKKKKRERKALRQGARL